LKFIAFSLLHEAPIGTGFVFSYLFLSDLPVSSNHIFSHTASLAIRQHVIRAAFIFLYHLV